MSSPKTSVIAIQLRITDLDGSPFDALPERAKMMITPARSTPPTVSPMRTQNSEVEMVGAVVAAVVEASSKAVTVPPCSHDSTSPDLRLLDSHRPARSRGSMRQATLTPLMTQVNHRTDRVTGGLRAWQERRLCRAL